MFSTSNRLLGTTINPFFTGYRTFLSISFGRFFDLVFGTKSGETSQGPTGDTQDNPKVEEENSTNLGSSCDDSPVIDIIPRNLHTEEVHDAAYHGGFIPMYQSEGRFRVSIKWPSGFDRKWVILDSHPDIVCTFDTKGPEFEFRRNSFKLQQGVVESGFYVNVTNTYEIEESTIDFALEGNDEVLRTVDVEA